MGPAACDPLDRERPDGAHERLPAAGGAADPVPARRGRGRRADRAAPVPGAARHPGRRLWLWATARVRRAPLHGGGAAARDLLAARTRGDDGTERPRRGVVPGRRGVPAPREAGRRRRCSRARRPEWGSARSSRRCSWRRCCSGSRCCAGAGWCSRASPARRPASRRSGAWATPSTPSTPATCSAWAPARSRTAPRPPTPAASRTASRSLYGMMDVSVLWKGLILALAVAGVVAGLAAWAWARRHRRGREALGDAAGAAVPFAAPLLVLGGAAVLALITDRWGFPIRGAGGILRPVNENLNQIYTHISNEDYSAFGPVGIVALILAIALGGPGSRAPARRPPLPRAGGHAAVLPRRDVADHVLEPVPDPLLPRAGSAHGAAPRVPVPQHGRARRLGRGARGSRSR